MPNTMRLPQATHVGLLANARLVRVRIISVETEGAWLRCPVDAGEVCASYSKGQKSDVRALKLQQKFIPGEAEVV